LIKQPSLLKFNTFKEELKNTPPQHAAYREFLSQPTKKNIKDKNGYYLKTQTELKAPLPPKLIWRKNCLAKN